jgi:hypothetical protein
MMGDFVKEKIAFAVALLAVLFTTSAFVANTSALSIDVFGADVHLRHLYYFVSGGLGLSVYCYGLRFISERPPRWVEAVGNALYAVSLIAPLAYVSLWMLLRVSAAVADIAPRAIPGALATIIGLGVGALGSVVADRVRRALDRRDIASEKSTQEAQGVALLERARRLLDSGNPDLAVVEAYKAVEVAFSIKHGAGRTKQGAMWPPEFSDFPQDLRERFAELRQLRNAAAHGASDISSTQAKQALDTADHVLAFTAAKSQKSNAHEGPPPSKT